MGAEDSQDDPHSSLDIRFSAPLPVGDASRELQLRVARDVDETRRIWHVSVTTQQAPDSPLCSSTFPLEAGREFYEMSLRHIEARDGSDIALVEAKPRPDEGPLDPPIYQLAFHLTERSPPDLNCRVVARGEYTELDGGPRLDFETVDESQILTRHQLTQDIGFCGDQTPESAPFEKLDLESQRFISAHTPEIDDDGATDLPAIKPEQALAPPLTEGAFAWISATSDIRGAPTGAAVRRPRMLSDQDLSTAWIEGVDGLGEREFVTANINTATSLRGLTIFPGHGHSERHFQAYGRPTRLLVGLSDGHRYNVDIPDYDYASLRESGGLYIAFPEPLITRCVSVMILEAKPGDPDRGPEQSQESVMNSVAISELTPLTVLDAEDESDTAHKIVEHLAREPRVERRDQIAELGTLIPAAISDAIAQRLKSDGPVERRRIVSYLGQLNHQYSLPVLIDHFRDIAPEDGDYLYTKRALASHGSIAAPLLGEVLQEFDPEQRKYVDTVRAIGRIGTDLHRIQLIEQLGEHGDALRNERIRAIASGGNAIIPRLVTEADSQGDSKAGLDALSALVFIGQRRFVDEQADVDGTERLPAIYRNSDSRAHRIRAIEALGYYHHPEAVDLLAHQLITDDSDPVIRQFAATALRLYPGDQARQGLERALDDPSPDVRIAAIQALNHRPDATDASPVVINYIEQEQWPRALHHALYLLARSPDREAQKAIIDRLHADITHPSAATALRALRRAENPLPTDEIEAIFANPETPQAIHEQLVHMLALGGIEGRESLLIEIANRDYPAFESHTDTQLDRLSMRAYLALGTSRTDAAKQFLLQVVADDDRFIDDRRAALQGLAFFYDAPLVRQLQQMRSQLPSDLRPRLQQTIQAIENRLAIQDAELDVQDLIDRLDEDSGVDSYRSPQNSPPPPEESR